MISTVAWFFFTRTRFRKLTRCGSQSEIRQQRSKNCISSNNQLEASPSSCEERLLVRHFLHKTQPHWVCRDSRRTTAFCGAVYQNEKGSPLRSGSRFQNPTSLGPGDNLQVNGLFTVQCIAMCSTALGRLQSEQALTVTPTAVIWCKQNSFIPSEAASGTVMVGPFRSPPQQTDGARWQQR